MEPNRHAHTRPETKATSSREMAFAEVTLPTPQPGRAADALGARPRVETSAGRAPNRSDHTTGPSPIICPLR